MQTFTKEQAEKILGKFPFLGPPIMRSIVGKANYLGGIEEFDKNPKNTTLYFHCRPNGLLIEQNMGFSTAPKVGLLNDQILSWVVEAQQQIYEQKEKSVIGRALVGGLLLGPVGAVVGGMSGMGAKQVRVDGGPDNLLTITYRPLSGEGEQHLVFKVANKDRLDVEAFFRSNYKR